MKRLATLFLLGFFAWTALAHESATVITTVILVRHAEKNLNPALVDPPLTPEGLARAIELAHVLAGTKVDAIFTTPFTRTRQTAAPLADVKKLVPVEVKTGPDYATDVAAKIRANHKGKTVVVIGHSNTTQQVIQALGIADAPAIPESQYDNLFIVTIAEGLEPRLVSLRYGAVAR
ncbi:MAG: phosphoglycerate mutase family protein [Acidobacteriota bacterium]